MKNDYSFKWFVAQKVEANAHFKAKKNIERQGLKHFYADRVSTRRSSKKFANHLIPLFLDIFLLFRSEADNFKWYSINNTFGVKKLITSENIPKISNCFVNCLKSRCDEQGKVMELRNIVGDKIKVSHGPFAEIIGEIENIGPKIE